MSAENETANVPGLDRGLAILEMLARRSLGMTMREISDSLDLPSASVFRLASTLERLGYVDRDPGTKRFTITSRLLKLGEPTANGKTLSECAIGPMRRVRNSTGETTQLCCCVDTEMVIIEQLLATQPFKYSAEIGARCPFYSCAPGKAIAAFLPEEDRAELLSRVRLKRFTANTITTKSRLRQELDQIRERGISFDRAEGFVGIHCVAAPILDAHGCAVAAITIAGPSERIPEDELASIGAIVRAGAEAAAEEFRR
jgi:IclR family acetate operon transcriptional repressor